MPCWDILGVEICIPSLDDIVNAVVAPITEFITESLTALISLSSELWTNLVQTIAPLFSTAAELTINFISGWFATLHSIAQDTWGAIKSLPDLIIGETRALYTQLQTVIIQVGTGIVGYIETVPAALEAVIIAQLTGIEGFITSVGSALDSSINTMGSMLSSAIETTGDTMLLAFDGMGNAVGSAITGTFGGLLNIDPTNLLDAGSAAAATLDALIRRFEETHSPIEPSEAVDFVSSFIPQVTTAYMTIFITNMVAEAATMGQVDFAPQASYRLPTTAAAVQLATDFVAMPLDIGLKPLFRRHILSSFQPNIPPYQDLISIYVKEGYLESHWVELPGDMVKWFSELGYSEYWTKRLWGKHWVYPSPTQLYEMLHRTAGTQPDIGVDSAVLSNMLKLHDFEPQWRPRLEAISWATWRIYDIRREWELGGGDDRLKKRLIDTGYNPVYDADSLAEVQKYYVLRTDILRLLTEADQDFIEGWIDEPTLRADYDATPLNPQTIELRISRAKLRRDREIKRDIKAALIDRFKKGDLTESELKQELSRLGITEAWIATEVTRAKAYKLQRITAS